MPFRSRMVSKRLQEIEGRFSDIIAGGRTTPVRDNTTGITMKRDSGSANSMSLGSEEDLKPMRVCQSYPSMMSSEDGPPVKALPGSPPLYPLIKCVVGAITLGLIVGSIHAGLEINAPKSFGAGGGVVDPAKVHEYLSEPNTIIVQASKKKKTMESKTKTLPLLKDKEDPLTNPMESKTKSSPLLKDKEDPLTKSMESETKTTFPLFEDKVDPKTKSSFTPGLAWLLSFPNSGTSYTMKLIETATGHNVASNYGDHNLHKVTKVSEPFFNDKPTFEKMREKGSIGPFIADAGGKKMTRAESGYVITKTHCGGYCFKCAPEKYTISDNEFLMKCASGGWVYNDKGKSSKPIQEKVKYNPKFVDRAVHLVRNPFDNIVSRYHLEHNHMERYDRKKDLKKFDREKSGFRKFCKQLNKKYLEDEMAFAKKQKGKGNEELLEALDKLKDVPCFQDLLKYINWHNHALEMTTTLKQPTLILHYEDYESDFDGTLKKLLKFLDQELTSDFTKEFIDGKSYAEEYFTEDEREKVRKAMKLLASGAIWKEYLLRYFEHDKE